MLLAAEALVAESQILPFAQASLQFNVLGFLLVGFRVSHLYRIDVLTFLFVNNILLLPKALELNPEP